MHVDELGEYPTAHCQMCPLYDQRTEDPDDPYGWVPPSGPLDADVLVVGEAPGRLEVRVGRPFVGQSGADLRKIFENGGIDPEGVRYLNTAQCRPESNEDPSNLAQMCCSSIFEEEVGRFNGKVIFAVGRVATNRFLGLAYTSNLLASRSSWDGYVYRWARNEWLEDGEIRAAATIGKGLVLDPGDPYKSGPRKGQPREVSRDIRLGVPRPPGGAVLVAALHPSFVRRTGFKNIEQFNCAVKVVAAMVDGASPYTGPVGLVKVTSNWEIGNPLNCAT